MQKQQVRLPIGKAAEYLGVSVDTLRRWEKKGRVTPVRSPGGHRYFEKDALDGLFGKKYSRDAKPHFAKASRGTPHPFAPPEADRQASVGKIAPKTQAVQPEKPVAIPEPPAKPMATLDEPTPPETPAISPTPTPSPPPAGGPTASTTPTSSRRSYVVEEIPAAKPEVAPSPPPAGGPPTDSRRIQTVPTAQDLPTKEESSKKLRTFALIIFVITIVDVIIILLWSSSRTILSPLQ